MHENSLDTRFYAWNIHRRNKRSILSNVCNCSLPLEIEKGRYTTAVTPLNFGMCKYCADKV